MNHVTNKLFIVLASVALFAVGCTKKPTRPSPDQTVLGLQSGGSDVSSSDVNTTADPNSGLDPRAAGWDAEGRKRGVLESVYFDFDRFNIKPSERAKLQAAAAYLKEHPGERLLLEGHCDWRGTAEYNLGLGDRRAAAAKAYLATIGAGATLVETISKGSLDAAQNGDEASSSKDRRVEIIVQR